MQNTGYVKNTVVQTQPIVTLPDEYINKYQAFGVPSLYSVVGDCGSAVDEFKFDVLAFLRNQ